MDRRAARPPGNLSPDLDLVTKAGALAWVLPQLTAKIDHGRRQQQRLLALAAM